jgi:hypothetical protein
VGRDGVPLEEGFSTFRNTLCYSSASMGSEFLYNILNSI